MDYIWETPDPSKATNLAEYLSRAKGVAYGGNLDHDNFVEARLLNEGLGINVLPMASNQNWYHVTHEGKTLGTVQVITDSLGTKIGPLRVNEVAISKLCNIHAIPEESNEIRSVNSELGSNNAGCTVYRIDGLEIPQQFNNDFTRNWRVQLGDVTFQSTCRHDDPKKKILSEYHRFIRLMREQFPEQANAILPKLFNALYQEFPNRGLAKQFELAKRLKVDRLKDKGTTYAVAKDKDGVIHFQATNVQLMEKKKRDAGFVTLNFDWNSETDEIVLSIGEPTKTDPRSTYESLNEFDERLAHKQLAELSFPDHTVEEVWEGDNSAYRLYKNGKVFGTTRYSVGEDVVPTLTVHKVDNNSSLRKVAFAVAGLLLLGSLNLFAAYVPGARIFARAADITSGSLVTLLFVRTLFLRRPRVARSLDGAEGSLRAHSPRTANTYAEYLKRAQRSIAFDAEYAPSHELVKREVREVANTPPIPTILDEEFRSGSYTAWIHTPDRKKPVLFQPPKSLSLENTAGGSAHKPYRYLFETLQRHYPEIDLELVLSKLNQNLLQEGAKKAETAYAHRPFGIELGPLEGIEYEVLSENSFGATAYRKVIQRKGKKEVVVGYVRIEASSNGEQVHSVVSPLLPIKPKSKERNLIHKRKGVTRLHVSALDDRFQSHHLPDKLQALNPPATWKKDLTTPAGREAYRKKLKQFKGVEILEDRAAWLGLSTARFNEKAAQDYDRILIPADVARDLNRSHFTFAPNGDPVSSSVFGRPLHRAPKNGEGEGVSLVESINKAYPKDEAGRDALISASCQATGVLPTTVAFTLFGAPGVNNQMITASIAAEYDLFQTEVAGDHIASARLRYELKFMADMEGPPLGIIEIRTISCARTGKRMTIVSDVRENDEAFEPRNSVTLTDYLDRLAPGAFLKGEVVVDGTDLEQDLRARIEERYTNKRLGIRPVIKPAHNDGSYRSVRIELVDRMGTVVGNTVIEQRYDAVEKKQNITYHPTRSERLIPPELLN